LHASFREHEKVKTEFGMGARSHIEMCEANKSISSKVKDFCCGTPKKKIQEIK
jgi:hypothetical protein